MSFLKLKNKKVAILGIGYIGSNILNYIKSLNIDMDITLITRENINIIEHEVFDYLINASGNSGDFRHQLIETIESNLNLNCYILKKAKIKENYIYISSSRVYGFSDAIDTVFREESISCDKNLDLNYIYDGSKKLTESLLFNYSKNVSYNIVIIRLSNVYGEFNNYDDSTLIKKIVRYKMQNKNNLMVKHNRHSIKDYIHISDTVESIVQIMLKINKTDVYNLAYGKSYSIDDISNFLDLKIETDESIKPIYSTVSNEKLISEFNIQPKYNLENELKKIILKG